MPPRTTLQNEDFILQDAHNTRGWTWVVCSFWRIRTLTEEKCLSQGVPYSKGILHLQQLMVLYKTRPSHLHLVYYWIGDSVLKFLINFVEAQSCFFPLICQKCRYLTHPLIISLHTSETGVKLHSIGRFACKETTVTTSQSHQSFDVKESWDNKASTGKVTETVRLRVKNM